MNEFELIKNIGSTKLDKVELIDGEIVEINDIQELIDRDIVMDSSIPNKYITHTGQEISYMRLNDADINVHQLKVGCTGFGKRYVHLQTGAKNGDIGNMIGNTVNELQSQVNQIEQDLDAKYGIVASFSESKIRYIEINRTFFIDHDFERYNRVIELILAEMPRMNTISTFGKSVNSTNNFTEKAMQTDTYSVWNRKKASGRANKYKQICVYNKSRQMQIELIGNYMRFEIKLKGKDNIVKAFGTDMLFGITQDKVDDYFKMQVQELIVVPLERWKCQRDKYILRLMQEQYREDIYHWQVNVLRLLANKELEDKKPCILDVQELFDIVDRLPDVSKKGRIKTNLVKQASRYERVFCNHDGWKLKELLDKLLIE